MSLFYALVFYTLVNNNVANRSNSVRGSFVSSIESFALFTCASLYSRQASAFPDAANNLSPALASHVDQGIVPVKYTLSRYL